MTDGAIPINKPWGKLHTVNNGKDW